MNYTVLYASMASILVAAGLTNILYQHVSASIGTRDICTISPGLCKGLLPWWSYLEVHPCVIRPFLCEDPEIPGIPWPPGPIELGDILSIPENQSYSLSVRHGPTSDTIMIEIPKALSDAILNQSTTGFYSQPQPPGDAILNQSTAGSDPQQQPPMIQSN
jgi:hypothetical protein